MTDNRSAREQNSDWVELVITDVTIHLSKHSKRPYLRIKLSGEAFDIFCFATSLLGVGGKILQSCGIDMVGDISGEDGGRANIADRCIGKTVTVRLGEDKWDRGSVTNVKEVM